MTTNHPPDRATLMVAQLKRLSYFYGQQLGPLDLQGEQAYLLEKHRLANRFLHGWGVVCGLEVVPVHPVDPKPATPAAQPGKSEDKTGTKNWSCVVVRPGLALDCHGNEVILRQPVVLDLWQELSADDQKRLASGKDTIWVSICYCERPVDPARPMYVDDCGLPADCAYARIRETVTFKVGLTPPQSPPRCESCAGSYLDPCVALARISAVKPGQRLEPTQIDNGIRRMLARHRLTTITGISFVHGATYPPDRANELLLKGFEVRFSDPVRVDSLTDQVVDILVYTGGSGVSGIVNVKRGSFEPVLTGEYTDRFVYRQVGKERLQYSDRVVIQVKADFILDECCRAVDGNHLGGRVPLLPGYSQFDATRPAACEVSPDRPGAWVSGNGSPGGTFEAWFMVEDEKEESGS